MSQQDPDLRDDPLNRVFPKVAKCNFNKYGPSGTVEIFDGLCILSLNIINEKAWIERWASLIWIFKTFSSDLCSPVVLVCDSVHSVCHPAGVESAVHYIKGLQGVHAQKTDKQHGNSKNNQTLHWHFNNCTIFRLSMLPSAVPSWPWGTGLSSCRLGTILMFISSLTWSNKLEWD